MNIVAIIFMILTLISLVVGVILMAKGGKANQKYGNKLMIMRVVFQAIAVIVLFAAYFVKKNS